MTLRRVEPKEVFSQRILEHIIPYIEDKLYLKVNREKTLVAYIGRVKFLGYGFYPSKDGIKLRVHPKSTSKMKAKIRELTSKNNGFSFEWLKLKLKQFITGWVNYFKLADMRNLLKLIDEWLRRRLRMYIWKRWKRVRTGYKMLRKLGLNHNNAYMFACTRKGYADRQDSNSNCYYNQCPPKTGRVYIFLGLLQICYGINLGTA